MSKRRPALGKGLSALLNNVGDQHNIVHASRQSDVPRVGMVAMIKIDSIEANPFQPRTQFEQESLNELAQSIEQLGIVQPVTVRKMSKDLYQLISGERRFRASQIAGKKEIPAFVRIANDKEMLEMALVENIQREDLDAIEVALSYQRLIEECSLTQEELSTRVGKKRATVTNYLRLLKLPAEIQSAIRSKQITMGHARALAGMKGEARQLKVLVDILKHHLSVRDVEQLSHKDVDKIEAQSTKKTKTILPPYFQKAQKEMKQTINRPVKIVLNSDKQSGNIIIPFFTKKEFEKLKKALYN